MIWTKLASLPLLALSNPSLENLISLLVNNAGIGDLMLGGDILLVKETIEEDAVNASTPGYKELEGAEGKLMENSSRHMNLLNSACKLTILLQNEWLKHSFLCSSYLLHPGL